MVLSRRPLISKTSNMEIYLEQIIGTAFGLAVFITAWIHAGKLPAGAPRATAPATKPRQYAEAQRPEVKQSPYNTMQGPENIDPLDYDPEEWDTIERTRRANAKIAAEMTRLKRAGLISGNVIEW